MLRISSPLKHKFILGQSVPFEETRNYEFKEYSGKNPIDSIKNIADEYTVAYLNIREKGFIIWGIRDIDRVVVGVRLNSYQIRDDLRNAVIQKLMGIYPAILPSEYRIHILPVYSQINEEDETEDLFVVIVETPGYVLPRIYFTSSTIPSPITG